jgi:hypothetical protein
MRCIGIVGGMSLESTAHHYRALNEGVKARLGGWSGGARRSSGDCAALARAGFARLWLDPAR